MKAIFKPDSEEVILVAETDNESVQLRDKFSAASHYEATDYSQATLGNETVRYGVRIRRRT